MVFHPVELEWRGGDEDKVGDLCREVVQQAPEPGRMRLSLEVRPDSRRVGFIDDYCIRERRRIIEDGPRTLRAASELRGDYGEARHVRSNWTAVASYCPECAVGRNVSPARRFVAPEV